MVQIANGLDIVSSTEREQQERKDGDINGLTISKLVKKKLLAEQR